VGRLVTQLRLQGVLEFDAMAVSEFPCELADVVAGRPALLHTVHVAVESILSVRADGGAINGPDSAVWFACGSRIDLDELDVAVTVVAGE